VGAAPRAGAGIPARSSRRNRPRSSVSYANDTASTGNRSSGVPVSDDTGARPTFAQASGSSGRNTRSAASPPSRSSTVIRWNPSELMPAAYADGYAIATRRGPGTKRGPTSPAVRARTASRSSRERGGFIVDYVLCARPVVKRVAGVVSRGHVVAARLSRPRGGRRDGPLGRGAPAAAGRGPARRRRGAGRGAGAWSAGDRRPRRPPRARGAGRGPGHRGGGDGGWRRVHAVRRGCRGDPRGGGPRSVAVPDVRRVGARPRAGGRRLVARAARPPGQRRLVRGGPRRGAAAPLVVGVARRVAAGRGVRARRPRVGPHGCRATWW
jgi:hypothetical protein